MNLRQSLERAIHRRVDEDVWTQLKNEGWCEDWEIVSGEDREKLLAEAARRARNLEGRGSRTQQAPQTIAPPDLRAELIAQLCARDARRWPAVRRFRQEALGGKLLRFEEVSAWIEEHSRAKVEPTSRLTLTLPPGHRVLEEKVGSAMRWRVDPPLVLDEVMVAEQREFGWYGTGGRVPSFTWSLGVETLAWIEPGNPWVRRAVVEAGGPLDRLRQIGGRLVSAYNWSDAHAVTFVLTDRPPPVRHLVVTRHLDAFGEKGRGRLREVISVTAESWVHPTAVLQAYRGARKEIGTGKTFPISEKAARLLLFVLSLPESLSWDAKRLGWNAEGAKSNAERYADTWAFYRDFDRGVRRIGPYVRFQGKGEPGEELLAESSL